MEHPSIANQVLSNESQAILLTQHSAVVVVPSKGSDLWVIESLRCVGVVQQPV
jgi:hypothetical protein